MKIIRSEFFGNVECETDKQQEEIFKYDSTIENFIKICQEAISDYVKDFSLFPERRENFGYLRCCIYKNKVGFPCIIFVYKKCMRCMFYYNKSIKYVYTMYHRESLTFSEIKDIMNCWKDISRLIEQFSKDVNDCGKNIENVCLEFNRMYRNTGKTLGQAINAMISSGYTKSEVLEAVINVLNDVKWED